MNWEQLINLLKQENSILAEDAEHYRCKEDTELTLLLDMGHDVLTISRIKQLAFRGEFLVIETHKGERFYTTAATPIRCVKCTWTESHRLSGTGFTSR